MSIRANALRIEIADRIEWTVDEPAYHDASELATQLVECVDVVRAEGARLVDARVHPPAAQLRTLRDLPPLRDTDLEDLLHQQSGRFFREAGGRPLIGAVRRHGANGSTVRAAMIDLSLAEAIEHAVVDSGLTLRRLEVVDDAEALHVPLFTSDLRGRLRRRRRLGRSMMVTLAALGWCVPAATYMADLLADGRVVSSRLEELEGPLMRMHEVEARLASFAPVAEAFRRQAPESAWLLRQVVGLTLAVPSGAHLHRLAAHRQEGLTVEAHGTSGLDVVEALAEWWPGRVRLREPPTPDGERGLELFTILLEGAP